MNHRAIAENGLRSNGAAPPPTTDDIPGDVGPPTGQVTFLMTDIEGSTRLWDNAPAAMRESLQRHDRILKETIEGAGGYVFCRAGDSFAAAFADPTTAFGAAVESQQTLRNTDWPVGAELRVRMAIHVGEADERDGNYFGPSLNRCSRLLRLCAGGSIALSDIARDEVDQLAATQVDFTDRGLCGLPDLRVPERVWFCDVGESVRCNGSKPHDDHYLERVR